MKVLRPMSTRCRCFAEVRGGAPEFIVFIIFAAVFPNPSGYRSATPPDFRCVHPVRQNPGAIQGKSAQIGNIRVTSRENANRALSK
ncbi:hypothetical protein GDO81_026231 [Engystomops pustulosus]|uniref:Uncharacterized protein n=1 Tax=Engystomops pustulosus TaxID=76066 RepID=A0AAV6YHC2_ENGPU|nr:hypothetical protein GDO81_026231 [Engystomops pustulosus]